MLTAIFPIDSPESYITHLPIHRTNPSHHLPHPLANSQSIPKTSYRQTRLYSKGRILGHKRGKRNSRPNQSLVQIEGVDSQEAARAYLGKVSWIEHV